MLFTDTDAGGVAVIVAHPDDETLWAGGTLLLHDGWRPHIITLCRGGDADRAPRFHRALQCYRAQGAMGDLDDGPAQDPLDPGELEATILRLLAKGPFNIILTHGPQGEYTAHRRHEEVSNAVRALWQADRLPSRQLWCFAYEDGQRAYYPRANAQAVYRTELPPAIWAEKYRILHEIYGFTAESWEAKTTPRCEAFDIYDREQL